MIYNDIRNNKIKTFFSVTFFIVFLTVFIYAISLFFENESTIGLGVFAGSFSIIVSLITYYNSDKIVLKLNKARKATSEEDQELTLLLEGITLGTGFPIPKLYVMDDYSINAFATGRNPKNSVICVTKGAIEKLNKYELEAVLAHELGHIKNYDILLSTIISVMVGFIVIISDVFRRSIFYGRRKKSDGASILMIIALIFIILSPIFSKLMQLSISRKREYLADATSVSITRNKDGMIKALEKIRDDSDELEFANSATAHMFIASPLKNVNKVKKNKLFQTHPPIEDRIKALQELN